MTKNKVTVKKKSTKKSADRIVNITKCNFVGVQFDEAATEAIITIATGLVENAKALGQLAYVLKASNVNIETMLTLEAPK